MKCGQARHYDPIEVSGSTPVAMQRATQEIATALEDMIATAPEQWYIFKPIWPQTQAERDGLADQVAQLSNSI